MNLLRACGFITLFLLNCFEKSIQGNHPTPYALSPVYLHYLEKVETRLYNVLRYYADTDNLQQQKIIQRYITEYEQVKVKSQQNSISGSSNEVPGYDKSQNPILSLQMINRFVKYFRNSPIDRTVLDDVIDQNALPSEKDVEDAMEALLRLHYFYDLDAYQLANGALNGVQTQAQLNARECFELGRLAQENAYFTLALQWFDVTLHKLENSNLKNDPSLAGLKKEMIIKSIRETITEHNEDYEESIQYGDMYSFSKPIHSTNYSAIAHLSLRKIIAKELTGKLFDQQHPKYNRAIEVNMLALCEGKSLQPEKVKARLKCYFDTKRHPYWRINPLKIEVLNETPRVIQMYNIFNDAWIAYLKNLSYAELERAPQPPEATPRTAAYAWFEDAAIPEITVSKTVEFITGLNVVGKGAAEELQVAAAAMGGHVGPHHDSFYLGDSDEPAYNATETGNQVNTFLIYLNEVENGGRTAFPLLGISIKPVKNSAVLWYTKLKNGHIDNKSLHAACPVVTGHKWIATKWTRIGENVLRRPCGLQPDE